MDLLFIATTRVRIIQTHMHLTFCAFLKRSCSTIRENKGLLRNGSRKKKLLVG